MDWLRNELMDSILFKSDELTMSKIHELKNESKDMKYAVSWLEEYSTLKLNDIAKEQENLLPSSYSKRKDVKDINEIKNILKNEKEKRGLKMSNLSSKTLISSINPNISIDHNFLDIPEELIDNIEDETFSIFKLDQKVGRENTLGIIGYYIFNTYGFYTLIKYPIFENFIKAVSRGYIRKNPYHNDLHAGDVTQTCMVFFNKGEINNLIHLDIYSLCALFISCMIHDFKHPGLTNNFLINTNDPIAVRYNDKSVLENYHVAEAFSLINSHVEYNIFSDLDKTESALMRKKMIQCILSTDMVHHAEIFSFIKMCIEKNSISKGKNAGKIFENLEGIKKTEMQQKFMDLIIHVCDISNPTKPYEIYSIWAERVMNEFYLQGDKEKDLGIPVSFLCDRNTTTIPQGQLGFIEGVVLPFYSIFVEFFPGLEFTIDNLINNKKIFKELKDNDEKEKNDKEKSDKEKNEENDEKEKDDKEKKEKKN